ncbi:hypothetical protein [Streptomyces sp. NBC_01803]|uniref:hypothetical protein n=1 Tax=Streptomyces sp. NBC_01803 TaxID=2975946 RepID=UPI002DD88615|nr:hypothetical protein [Streptomyces sp. NBC_01803]WSA45616.1 hypothetical protein OIE51_16250 [Streptomyces sp. NBC_01803]
MNAAVAPLVRAGQRPLVRRSVLRWAGVTARERRLTVRTRGRTHTWELGAGGGGVVSAAHLKGRLCPAAGHAGWGDIGSGEPNKAGGCLHLCDSAGAGLACLIVSDWVPVGPTPLTLAHPDGLSVPVDDTKTDDFLRLSGLGDFLRYHDVPVREVSEAPPPAATFAGTLRPGAKSAFGLPALLAVAQLVVGWLAAFFVGGLGSGEGAERAALLLMSGSTLVFALLTAGLAAVLGALASRGGRAVAELRPAPAIPVTRAFLARASVRAVGEDLELRTAQNVTRLMRGPADPVLGVREALILEDRGRPWGVALVDGRESVQAFLHWDTWCGGDPGQARLRAFCDATGIPVRRHALRRSRHGTADGGDRTARRWTYRDYTSDTSAYPAWTAFVVLFLTAFQVGFGAWAGFDWAPYYLCAGLAFAIGCVPYAVRACWRRFRLNQMVTDRREPAKEWRDG